MKLTLLVIAASFAIAVTAGFASAWLADQAVSAWLAAGDVKLAALLQLTVGGVVFASVGALGIAFLADDATRASAARLVRRLPGLRG